MFVFVLTRRRQDQHAHQKPTAVTRRTEKVRSLLTAVAQYNPVQPTLLILYLFIYGFFCVTTAVAVQYLHESALRRWIQDDGERDERTGGIGLSAHQDLRRTTTNTQHARTNTQTQITQPETREACRNRQASCIHESRKKKETNEGCRKKKIKAEEKRQWHPPV